VILPNLRSRVLVSFHCCFVIFGIKLKELNQMKVRSLLCCEGFNWASLKQIKMKNKRNKQAKQTTKHKNQKDKLNKQHKGWMKRELVWNCEKLFSIVLLFDSICDFKLVWISKQKRKQSHKQPFQLIKKFKRNQRRQDNNWLCLI